VFLKPGFHMIVRIVRIVPVVSKNVQTIGTIIWKRYPEDRKLPGSLQNLHDRPDRPDRTRANSILSKRSRSAQSSGSFAIVWVAFPYDRPDRLDIFLGRLRRSRRSGRSYGNQALVFRIALKAKRFFLTCLSCSFLNTVMGKIKKRRKGSL